MTIDQLVAEATELKVKLSVADEALKRQLHRQLHSCLTRIKAKGGTVPGHLRQLDLELTDQEVEAQFDNMPI